MTKIIGSVPKHITVYLPNSTGTIESIMTCIRLADSEFEAIACDNDDNTRESDGQYDREVSLLRNRMTTLFRTELMTTSAVLANRDRISAISLLEIECLDGHDDFDLPECDIAQSEFLELRILYGNTLRKLLDAISEVKPFVLQDRGISWTQSSNFKCAKKVTPKVVIYGQWYWEVSQADVVLSDDELALVLKNKIRRHVSRLASLGGLENRSKTRESISEEVRMHVWARDGGRCCKCGSSLALEFDHIIPVSKGGSNTARNLQILCETCNRTKGDLIQ